jgi:predicted ATPase
MAISRVEIKDFLVFQGDFAVDFCPGVNVFIGGNSTGKTTLLKGLYSLSKYHGEIPIGAPKINSDAVFDYGMRIERYFHNFRIYKYTSFGFKLDDNALVFSGSNENTIFKVFFDKSNHKELLIPEKDILEHSKGLLALNNLRDIPFDQTYIDLLSNAELGETKEISKTNNIILSKIKDVIGGEVEFENDTFYTAKFDGQKIPFSLEASGYRKFGLLWKLARNGLLESGTTLFWDEPENSLNPELIPTLVDILLELQKGGVQIFIATHSYDVARWFELNKKTENSLRYFNLRKTDSGIAADVADDYVSLDNNPIDATDDKLLKRVVEVSAEKAGVRRK